TVTGVQTCALPICQIPNSIRDNSLVSPLIISQESPDVAAAGDGSYYVVWTDSVVGTFTNDLVARHFDALGNPLTGDIFLSFFPFNVTSLPAATNQPISGQADGLAVAFAVTAAGLPNPNDAGIFLERTNSSLTPIPPAAITVDAISGFHDTNPAITAFPNGNCVVSYTKDFPGGRVLP